MDFKDLVHACPPSKMKGYFLAWLCACLWVPSRPCPSFKTAPESQALRLPECLSGLRPAPPDERFGPPVDPSSSTSALETQIHEGPSHKRQKVWKALFPHRSWESPWQERAVRFSERSQLTTQGLLKPQLRNLLASEGVITSWNLLTRPRSNGRRSLLDNQLGVEVQPPRKHSQGLGAIGRGRYVISGPSQAPAFGKENSPLQHIEPVGSIPAAVGVDLDQYLSSIVAFLADHSERQQLQNSEAPLTADNGNIQGPGKVSTPKFPASRAPEPDASFCAHKSALNDVMDRFLARYSGETNSELCSVRSFITSVLHRWNEVHTKRCRAARNERLLHPRRVEERAFGLNFEITDVTPFACYPRPTYRRNMPSLEQGDGAEYSKLVHEVSVQAGKRRTGILGLNKAATRVSESIKPLVEAWYFSAADGRLRSIEHWMKLVEGSIYSVINYIVMLEYITTSLKTHQVREMRKSIATFLLRSEELWAYFFRGLCGEEELCEPENLLLHPKLISDIIKKKNARDYYRQAHRFTELMFSTWCKQRNSQVYGKSIDTLKTIRRFGLPRFLDDCAFVEWLQLRKQAQ